MDERILAITLRELVAAEAHYRRTCYRDYTRAYYSKSSKVVVDDDDQSYSKIESDAFQMLFDSIRSDLFTSPRIVPMMDLIAQLVDFMKDQGVEEVWLGTKKHIRRKLEAEFGESLSIFHNNGKLLVVPDSLDIKNLSSQLMSIKKEFDSLRENTSGLTQSVRKVAKLIRNELKTTHTEDLSWPPNPVELDKDYLPLSPFATLFLTTLISGDPDKPATSRIQRLVLSIFQDLMFAVSEGTCLTAKHVFLPWTVKTLTGNVELIKMFNRFGHGISYSKLEEIETALCLQKIENVNEMGVALPLNVYPRVPTTLAFDNIDRLEETLSGGGTSHRVNGIAVQPMVHTIQAPKPPASMPKQRKRSIDHVEYASPSYNTGQRVGPPLVKRLRIDCSEDVKIAEMKNLTWCVV